MLNPESLRGNLYGVTFWPSGLVFAIIGQKNVNLPAMLFGRVFLGLWLVNSEFA